MGTQPRYRYLLFVTLLLIGALLALQACGRNDAPATETPRAGGVVVDEEAAGEPSPESGTVAAPAEQPTAAPTPVIYTIGSVITAGTQIAIFATAASSSSVLEVYSGGTPFTVLEPNESYTTYPVTNGGASWVRVRAGDGLAGWAKAESLSN